MDPDGQRWSLQGVNSGPEPLLGCCKNVPIEVGGIHFDHDFFVKSGDFNDHELLLGQPWLMAFGAQIGYEGANDGNHSMRLQVYDQGNRDKASVIVQALINESREQTKLVTSVKAIPPAPPKPPSIQEFPDSEELHKQYDCIHTSPSISSLTGYAPSIPTFGRELSEAL